MNKQQASPLAIVVAIVVLLVLLFVIFKLTLGKADKPGTAVAPGNGMPMGGGNMAGMPGMPGSSATPAGGGGGGGGG